MNEKNTKCPLCGKQASSEYFPFCSKRCADIDLYRWLKGDYAIPTNEVVSNDNNNDAEKE